MQGVLLPSSDAVPPARAFFPLNSQVGDWEGTAAATTFCLSNALETRLGWSCLFSARRSLSSSPGQAPLSPTPPLCPTPAPLKSLQSFPLPEYSGSASGAGVVEDPLFGSALVCSEADSDLVGGWKRGGGGGGEAGRQAAAMSEYEQEL